MKIKISFIFVSLFLSNLAFAEDTSFTYESQPKNYYTKGASGSFTPINSRFVVSGTAKSIKITINTANHSWSIYLSAPYNKTFEPAFYPEIYGFGSNSPSVNYFVDGTGCESQSVKGSLKIYDIGVDESGTVSRLAADFSHFCGSTVNAGMFGAIRYKSNAPVDIKNYILHSNEWYENAGAIFGGGNYVASNNYILGHDPDAYKADVLNDGNGISITYGKGTWSFDFAAPKGQLLKTGVYENAQRYPFGDPAHPGISISGDGKGCNRESGTFNILDIQYGDNNQLKSLAVDFSQYCEDYGSKSGKITGAIRYHSAIPMHSVESTLYSYQAEKIILPLVYNADTKQYNSITLKISNLNPLKMTVDSITPSQSAPDERVQVPYLSSTYFHIPMFITENVFGNLNDYDISLNSKYEIKPGTELEPSSVHYNNLYH